MTRDELIEKLKELPNVHVLDGWHNFIKNIELRKIQTYKEDYPYKEIECIIIE